jgi:hypothetical protein
MLRKIKKKKKQQMLDSHQIKKSIEQFFELHNPYFHHAHIKIRPNQTVEAVAVKEIRTVKMPEAQPNDPLLAKQAEAGAETLGAAGAAGFGIMDVISGASSLFMIFGGVVPYIPQYRMINKSLNAKGFSTLVCLSLLVANMLRILFWFGHPYETPLLLQSIIMIGCMLFMLELCVRCKRDSIRSTQLSGLNTSVNRRFLDFERDHFWAWTDFTSYIQFVLFFFLFMGLLMRVFIHSVVFVETIGFLSVFTEAMLAAPQFYRNFVNKSTEGMSIVMVIMWTSGDLFKTTYFILRDSPIQFWLCGMIQVTLDLMVLTQVYLYRDNKKSLSK